MIGRAYTWIWSQANSPTPTHTSSVAYSANRYNGMPNATGHINVYVDRDHETQDPPPPGAVPIGGKYVELILLPERYIIAKKLTSASGYVSFGSLDPALAGRYAVFALGVQKGDGSGEWYVAEMYDRLTPEAD